MGKILKTCSEQSRLVSGCFIKVFRKMTTCPRQLLLSDPKSSYFIQVWMYLENVFCWILRFDANYICKVLFRYAGVRSDWASHQVVHMKKGFAMRKIWKPMKMSLIFIKEIIKKYFWKIQQRDHFLSNTQVVVGYSLVNSALIGSAFCFPISRLKKDLTL